MTADEIRLALRMVAIGRTNHPLIEQLAAELEGVLPKAVPMDDCGREVLEVPVVEPKRRKKAD